MLRTCVAILWVAVFSVPAAAQSVLVFDATPAAGTTEVAQREAATAAAWLDWEVAAVRTVSELTAAVASGRSGGGPWDTLVVDAGAVALTPQLLAAVRAHLDEGGSLIFSSALVGRNDEAQRLLGLRCDGVAPSAAIVAEADAVFDVFGFVEPVPSPLDGVDRYAPSGALCTPTAPDRDVVLARFDRGGAPPALLTTRGRQVIYSAVALDVLRTDAADEADRDDDGRDDSTQLFANLLEASKRLRLAPVAVVSDRDTPELDAWFAEQRYRAVPVASAEGLVALAAADELRAVYVALADLDVADPALPNALEAVRGSGVPVLVFAPTLADSPAWQAALGVSAVAGGADARVVGPGTMGLEQELFTTPRATPALGVNADAAGAGWQVIDAAAEAYPVARFDASDGDVAAVVAASGGLIVGTFSPADVGGDDSDHDGRADVAVFLENARTLAAGLAPIAVILSDVAAGSPAAAAARRAGTYPLVQRTPVAAAETLGAVEVAVLVVESRAAVAGAFEDAALNAAVGDHLAADGAVLVTAADLDQLPGLADAAGVSVVAALAASSNVVANPFHLARVFSLPTPTPATLAMAASSGAARGHALRLDDPAAHDGSLVARYAAGGAASWMTHNGRVIVNGFSPALVGQSDSDRDGVADIVQLLAGQLEALRAPRTALVFDAEPGDSVLAAAARVAGLRAEATDDETAFLDALADGGQVAVAVDASGSALLATGVVVDALTGWAGPGGPLLVASPALHDYRDMLTSFGAAATAASERASVVEPRREPLGLFEAPFVVPSPVRRGRAVFSERGAELTGDDAAVLAACFGVNVGPAASLIVRSGTTALNGFAPRELIGDDADGDGTSDRVALFANQLVRVVSAPVVQPPRDAHVDEGGTVILSSAGTLDPLGGSLVLRWDLDGDGEFDDASGVTATFSAASIDGPATASVGIEATQTTTGARTRAWSTVTIDNVPATLAAGADRTVGQGLPVTLSVAISDVAGDTHLVTWELGDGNTATGREVTHTYADLGAFPVRVTVVDDDGGSATASFTVTHQNSPPTITLSQPAPVDEGGAVAFVAEVADPGGDVVGVTWDFGDGSTGEGLTPTHVYADNGTFSFSATATDENAGRASRSLSVVVRNVAPVFSTEPSLTVVPGVAYRYQAAAFDPGADTIRWSLSAAPPGMTVGADGLLSWTPGPLSFGEQRVELNIDDGDGGTARQAWSLFVPFSDRDRGGAPDDCEEAFGFDPGNADDDGTDPDGDGWTVAQECLRGSNPTVFSGPPMPTLVSPVGRALVRDLAVPLVVRNVADPDGDPVAYDFQVFQGTDLARRVTEASSVPAGPGEVTSVTVTGRFDEDQVYGWRARAVSTDGASDWTALETFIFSQTNASPGPVTQIYPIEFASEVRPALRVGSAPDPEMQPLNHEFELYRGPAPREDLRIAVSPLVPEGAGGETAWTVPADLTEGSEYTWRARARDAAGGVGPFVTASFIVDATNSAPSEPVIVEPVDGATLPPAATVVLRWTNAVDADGDAITYVGDLSTDPRFAAPERTFSREFDPRGSTSVTINLQLEPLTTYYWRVAALDRRAQSPYAVASFTTRELVVNVPATAPRRIAPSAGEEIPLGEAVELIVDNAADANGDTLVYEFQVAGNVDMTIPVATRRDVAEGDETTSIVLEDLEVGAYFWRARAFDGAVQSPWSEIGGFFVVDEAPEVDAGVDSGAGDTDGDAGIGDDASESDDTPRRKSGCAAAPGSAPAPWVALVALATACGVARRRRPWSA